MSTLLPAPALPLADVETYLRARGLGEHYPDALVWRNRPDPVILKTGKDRLVVLTAGNGPGLTGGELHQDRRVVDVRCVGTQGRRGDNSNYDDAEQFANAVDRWLQSGVNVMVGSTLAYGVFQMSAPTHIDTDQSRRVHMTASYIFPVASGL